MLLKCKNSVRIYELFHNYFIELIHLEIRTHLGLSASGYAGIVIGAGI